ncbi:MAG TPA: VOC family protein [Puia sp.]|nr:VOC family protein [Puia sp.]
MKTNEQFHKPGYDFIIRLAEIDSFYDEVKSNGAEITEGIVKRIYGDREFVIKDCDAHKILVCD